MKNCYTCMLDKEILILIYFDLISTYRLFSTSVSDFTCCMTCRMTGAKLHLFVVSSFSFRPALNLPNQEGVRGRGGGSEEKSPLFLSLFLTHPSPSLIMPATQAKFVRLPQNGVIVLLSLSIVIWKVASGWNNKNNYLPIEKYSLC